MFEVCNLCRVLANPLRLEILARIYCAQDGFNVGFLADEMQKHKLGLSAISQYLMQLERMGLVRRRREGRYVNYYPVFAGAPASIRGIVKLIVENLRSQGSRDYVRAFVALKNPFRAKVVGLLSRKRSLSTEAICVRFSHKMWYLYRDLKSAIDAGLIRADGNCSDASYFYIPPKSEIVQLMIEEIAKTIK
jgi:DNA-binding transcriptional ArsR family regulator